MPAVRGSMPCPAREFNCPFPVPLNRPQSQPPFQYAQQCFRPAMCEPVFRPQPLPEQCLQFRGASFSEPSLQFPCRPCMIPPFEVPCVADINSCTFPRMECQPSVSFHRQPFFQAQTADDHFQSLQGLPCTSELNVVSVSSEGIPVCVQSSSESTANKQVTLDQAKRSCAVSEPVQVQSQSVFPGYRENLDIMQQRSSDHECDRSSHVCEHDEHKRRRRDETRHAQHSRQSRGESRLHPDSHRRGSRPEKR